MHGSSNNGARKSKSVIKGSASGVMKNGRSHVVSGNSYKTIDDEVEDLLR